MFVSHVWPAGLLPPEAIQTGEVCQRGCQTDRRFPLLSCIFFFIVSFLLGHILCFPRLLLFLLLRFSSCSSFLSGADRSLGGNWGGICCKSASVLQLFQRSGAILQWIQVRISLEQAAQVFPSIFFSKYIFFKYSCKYITIIQFVLVIINHKLAELTLKRLLGTLDENKFPFILMRTIISIIISHKCYFFDHQKTFIITSGRQAAFRYLVSVKYFFY